MIKVDGFTLIELLIVIAIIGTLAGIAYPSYQGHLIQSRRTEAQVELVKAQLKQSGWHILNPEYSSDKNEVGLVDSDHYTFSIVSAGKTHFLMKAVAKSTSPQNKDKSSCKTLFIDQDSHHTSDGSIDNESCW